MPKITSLYAWIATEKDGDEGVPAITMVIQGMPHMTPMLGADLARIESLAPQVREVLAETSAKMRLARFELVEELGDLASFKPGRSGRNG